MTRFSLLLLVALIAAPAVLAQDKDYSRYEFVGGYAFERASNNAATFDKNGRAAFNGNTVLFDEKYQSYNGFYAEFNQNITRNVGIVTSFTGTYDTSDYVNLKTGRVFPASVQRYDLMIGPRYNWRLSGVTPFVHAMAGITHMRVNFDDTLSPVRKADTAFAMAFGGGLDVHAGEHIDIRVVQVDYLPTFFNSTHQNNIKVGAGVKIK
jgi:opacity protein-like surface antigen